MNTPSGEAAKIQRSRSISAHEESRSECQRYWPANEKAAGGFGNSGLVAANADLDGHAGARQLGQAFARHGGMGIAAADDNAGNAGLDERSGTRRSLPLMAAGFERNVGGPAACLGAGGFQGFDFGVRAAERLVPAFAYGLAVAHQDAAHHGIWLDSPLAALRQHQGASH